MKRYMALLADMRGYLDEDPDGDWVRYEDVEHLAAAAGELRPMLDLVKKKDARIAELVRERDALSAAFNRAHERELKLEADIAYRDQVAVERSERD